LLVYFPVADNEEEAMRKVLTFGAGGDFADRYGAFLRRHGFEPVLYNPRKDHSGLAGRSVLLVMGERLTKEVADAAIAFSNLDRRHLPLVYVNGGESSLKAELKKLKGLARFSLCTGFGKMELLVALKGCEEVLALGEKCSSLKEELAYKTDELSYVLDIARALASSFELGKVLSKIMERACTLVDARTWLVMLVDEESDDLVFEAASGRTRQKANKYRLKIGEGVAGWAAKDKSPKLVADITKEKHFLKAIDRVVGVSTRSIMAVPIMSKGRLLGVIEVINKDGVGGFTDKDQHEVSRLMDQMALAIDRSRMYQKMEGLVITDDLTKLFNLRYLQRSLDVEIERAMRYGLSVAVMFIDMDYFKQVNDSHGHLVGSKLLVEVSHQLLKSLRKVDIVARYGGDEFVIVLPQTDVNAAKMIAERLRKNIEKHVFMKSENLALKLTASFGIACYPDHAATKEDLIKLADDAMYRVKHHTRNSVYVVGS